MMRLIEGGIRMPSVPPAAMLPRNSGSLYPKRLICGSATVPTVAAVATLEPLVAANTVLAPMLACISPPGSQLSHLAMASYMRCAKPARSRISPNRMNSGMATSRNSLDEPQAISPMARLSGRLENSGSSNNPSTPSAAATGMLMPSSTSRRMRDVAIMSRPPRAPGAHLRRRLRPLLPRPTWRRRWP